MVELVIGVEPTTYWLQISCSAIELHQLGKMAIRRGLEPLTSSVTGWHSNQLNYRTTLLFVFKKVGGPSGTRTPDQSVMSRPLWPTELKALINGDPWENRTPVTTVKGWCLNRLTKGPLFKWSGWQDLNLRPSGPKPDALPNCATPRFNSHRDDVDYDTLFCGKCQLYFLKNNVYCGKAHKSTHIWSVLRFR